MSVCLQYAVDNGISSQTVNPYYSAEGNNGNCTFEEDQVVAKYTSWQYINPATEEGLMQAVAVAPVACAMAVNDGVLYYGGGIYDDPSCAAEGIEHGIAVVGYSQLTNGTEYYILKNSFGTSWGMEGYMWLKRNAGNICLIANQYDCYPTIDDYSDYIDE